MLLKWTLTLAVALTLQACSDDSDRIEGAKKALEARLVMVDVEDITYENMETFPGNVVCGKLTSVNPRTGRKNIRPFIVRGERADENPSDDDWFIFCTRDSAAALQSRFGIGPADADNENLHKIRRDITRLELALDEYLKDNFFLPTTRAGLAALTPSGKKPPPPAKFREGGYIAEIPNDPWGRPYHYERSALGGYAHGHELYTLGADGIEGGQGQDADVGKQHMHYLDHIFR